MVFNLLEEIQLGLEGVIHFRTEKAAEHPGDRRNGDAVDLANRLLAGDRTITPAIQARFDHLDAALEAHPDVDDLAGKVSTVHSEIFRHIGFWSEPQSYDALASELCDAVDAILADGEQEEAA